MLRVLLLGAPQVIVAEQVVPVARRKSRALLYYLAAHAAPITREHVLTTFWPDLERSAAQQVLRTTLHGLRKTLGDAIVSDAETLRLEPTSFVDSREFDAHLHDAPSTEQLAQTLDLYRGDFLADFSVIDAEAFEAWASNERERFRQLMLHGLITLAQRYEQQHDLGRALNTLARAFALDPLQEEAQRVAMRVQYRSGDRAGAIRRFEQLRTQLDDELGVPPMAETQALYDAIITDSLPVERAPSPVALPAPPAPSIQRADVLPFTGRSAELAQLDQIIAAQQLAIIEGEPGIGKTRLAEEWLSHANRLVLVGACYEMDQALPYQPLIEAFRDLIAQPTWSALRARLALPPVWRAELARLLPEIDATPRAPVTSAETADESRLWEGIHQFLSALAAQQSLVLFLDDLHWADGSTLAVLGYLARRQSSAINIVATARPVSVRSRLATLLQTLTRTGRLGRVRLERLSYTATIELARHLSPNYSYPLADWLTHAAEGNPYILTELVRHAREQHWLQPNGTLNLTALSYAPVLPQTVSQLIESRIVTLSDAAQRVLHTAVAVGREFEFNVVTRASQLSEATVLDAIDELREAALIHPTEGPRFAFDHTLTMEVAYRQIGEPRHRLIHRQIAAALEQIAGDQGETAGLIAWHFAEGDAPQQATPYAIRAGLRAAQLAAWQEAIGFFELALPGATTDERLMVLLELGKARVNIGDAARGAEVLRGALELAEQQSDAMRANEARLVLVQALLQQGRFADMIATVQPLLATDDAASAEFFWGAALSLEGADLCAAVQHLRRSEQLLETHPEQQDGINLARVLFERAGIAAQQGDLEEAIQLYHDVLALGDDNAPFVSIRWRILAYNNLAYHLHLLGDSSAMEFAQRGLALAREQGTLLPLMFLFSTIGEIRLAHGEIDEAERSFNNGLELAEQFAAPERIAGLTANLGLIALRRGETVLAIHRLSTALAQADALGTRHLSAQIRIWLAPLLPPKEGLTTLAEARSIAESGGRQRLLAEIAHLERHIRDQESGVRSYSDAGS